MELLHLLTVHQCHKQSGLIEHADAAASSYFKLAAFSFIFFFYSVIGYFFGFIAEIHITFERNAIVGIGELGVGFGLFFFWMISTALFYHLTQLFSTSWPESIQGHGGSGTATWLHCCFYYLLFIFL